MIITSSSLSIHTFLNIATAATGITPAIDILYVCINVHVMHMCIYGFMYIHTKIRSLLNFYCNNLSKPTLLSIYEILHYDFKAFLVVLTRFKVFLMSRLPTGCTRFHVIVVYLNGICLIYLVFVHHKKNIWILFYSVLMLAQTEGV